MARTWIWILMFGLTLGPGCSGEADDDVSCSDDDDDTGPDDDDTGDDDADTAHHDDCWDLDGDGYEGAGECYDDCNEQDPDINPGAEDTVGDGVDNNCDGIDGVDADEDGHASIDSGGDDCDDHAHDVHPGALEACDEIDRDCDPATTGENAVLVDSERVYATIGDAVSAAYEGSELLVCPGTYAEAVVIDGETLTVASLNGSTDAVIAPLVGSAIQISSSTVALRGLTLRDGTGSAMTVGPDTYLAGGGLRVENAALTLEDVVIEECTAELGAGIVAFNSSVEGVGVTLRANVATEGGGGLFAGTGAAVAITDSAVLGNLALGYGGGAKVEGTLTSTNSDWGVGETDNDPEDVNTDDDSYTQYGAGATFVCTAEGCG